MALVSFVSLDHAAENTCALPAFIVNNMEQRYDYGARQTRRTVRLSCRPAPVKRQSCTVKDIKMFSFISPQTAIWTGPKPADSGIGCAYGRPFFGPWVRRFCGHNGSLTVRNAGLAVKMISCRNRTTLPDIEKGADATQWMSGCGDCAGRWSVIDLPADLRP
jgi:hypothetical protein